MADENFNQADLEAVVAELGDAAGLDAVEQRLESVAPQLQKLLDGALSAGGWFDDAHESMVLKTATQPDADQRIAEVRNFVLEQTRLGMLVGVAVGWELAERLVARRSPSS
ncbi:MAG: hypothetical protein HYX29_02910 [Solirubrobacterales bacterium]|nr:hypothetical protein [Solirubrobacterales bacterium]